MGAINIHRQYNRLKKVFPELKSVKLYTLENVQYYGIYGDKKICVPLKEFDGFYLLILLHEVAHYFQDKASQINYERYNSDVEYHVGLENSADEWALSNWNIFGDLITKSHIDRYLYIRRCYYFDSLQKNVHEVNNLINGLGKIAFEKFKD